MNDWAVVVSAAVGGAIALIGAWISTRSQRELAERQVRQDRIADLYVSILRHATDDSADHYYRIPWDEFQDLIARLTAYGSERCVTSTRRR